MHRIDPVCLPQTVGIVDCLLQNPFESVDGGVIEEDGDIHSPLYASRAHLATINTSSEIRIRGGAFAVSTGLQLYLCNPVEPLLVRIVSACLKQKITSNVKRRRSLITPVSDKVALKPPSPGLPRKSLSRYIAFGRSRKALLVPLELLHCLHFAYLIGRFQLRPNLAPLIGGTMHVDV